MKKSLHSYSLLCLLITLSMLPLQNAAASDCAYFDKNGEHDLYQAEVHPVTCTEDGYYILRCRSCNYQEKRITAMASGHVLPSQPSRTKKATCDEKGENVFICQECGEEQIYYTPALGHKWTDAQVLEEPSCTEDGYMQTVCERCHLTGGRVLAKKGHSYGAWQITQQATDHSKGKRVRRCSSCGISQTDSFYPDGTLYRGMKKNDAVQKMQQQLKDLDILHDKADGIFGKKTEKAVRDFQSRAAFEVTGIAYPQTLQALLKDWNKKMGKEDVPVPSETESFSLCESHQTVDSAANTLLNAADTPEKKLNALHQAQNLWKTEVDFLYDQLTDNAPEEMKSSIRWANVQFEKGLALHREKLTAIYPDQPEAVEKQLLEEIKSQCMYLCSRSRHPETQENSASGSWYLNGIYTDGQITDAAQSGMEMTLILDIDGSALQKITKNGQTTEDQGSWTQENGVVTITFQNEPAAFKLYQNVMVYEDGNGRRMITGRERVSFLP